MRNIFILALALTLWGLIAMAFDATFTFGFCLFMFSLTVSICAYSERNIARR